MGQCDGDCIAGIDSCIFLSVPEIPIICIPKPWQLASTSRPATLNPLTGLHGNLIYYRLQDDWKLFWQQSLGSCKIQGQDSCHHKDRVRAWASIFWFLYSLSSNTKVLGRASTFECILHSLLIAFNLLINVHGEKIAVSLQSKIPLSHLIQHLEWLLSHDIIMWSQTSTWLTS